jgi:hypothetical protein
MRVVHRAARRGAFGPAPLFAEVPASGMGRSRASRARRERASTQERHDERHDPRGRRRSPPWRSCARCGAWRLRGMTVLVTSGAVPRGTKTTGIDSARVCDERRVRRVMNLLTQLKLSRTECARLLRRLAEFLEPSGMSACDVCSSPFVSKRRSHVHCSEACRAVACRRRRHALRHVTDTRLPDETITRPNGRGNRSGT